MTYSTKSLDWQFASILFCTKCMKTTTVNSLYEENKIEQTKDKKRNVEK